MYLKRKFREGQSFDTWVLKSFLNTGGNGEVWVAEDDKKQAVAIKILRKIGKNAYERFRDEINIVKRNSDIVGILPIIDSFFPDDLSRSIPWYTMPLATPLYSHLKDKDPYYVIETVISLSDIMSKLHARNISHRDIKPSNLFMIESQVYIGDFGLVKYPSKKDLTKKGEEVGPKWTMAPEMKRDAQNAEGRSADVYSMAKTLWIFLTRHSRGFEGQYNVNSINSLSRFQTSLFCMPLDKLIRECTDDDPSMRPTANEFSERLREWKTLNTDFELRNAEEWRGIQCKIFPFNIPNRAIWEDNEQIRAVLEILGSVDNLNYMLLPEGGGLDLDGAGISNEKDCIELKAHGSINIVKPKRLVFESFESDPEWNYFRLETEGLEKSGVYEDLPVIAKREVVTEIAPCLYTDYDCWLHNEFNGGELPAKARPVVRYFQGDFIIVQKTSKLNRIPYSYFNDISQMPTDQMKDFVTDLVMKCQEQGLSKVKKKGEMRFEEGPKAVKQQRYRKNERVLSNHEVEIVTEVVRLADERDKESVELKTKYRIKMIRFPSCDENQIEYLMAPRPRGDALRQYLRKLTQKDLAIVGAVMYGGREYEPPYRAPPLDKLIADFIEDPALIEQICEKVPLAEYLRAGIEAYSTE